MQYDNTFNELCAMAVMHCNEALFFLIVLFVRLLWHIDVVNFYGVKKMNILILDDRNIFGQALGTLIRKCISKSVVYVKCLSGDDVIVALDLVILVVQKGGGITKSHCFDVYPGMPIIGMVDIDDLDGARLLLERGAGSIMLSNYSVAVMLSTIRRCLQGFHSIPVEVEEYARLYTVRQSRLLLHCKMLGLTRRQLEVLEKITLRLSNREIADNLFVSLATVKTHVNCIYGALGVANRRDCLARAKHLGLIDESHRPKLVV